MEGPLNFLGIIGWVRQCVPQCMPPLTHRLIGVTYRSEVCKIVSFVLNWQSWAANKLSSRLQKSQKSRIGNSYSDKYLCGTVQTVWICHDYGAGNTSWCGTLAKVTKLQSILLQIKVNTNLRSFLAIISQDNHKSQVTSQTILVHTNHPSSTLANLCRLYLNSSVSAKHNGYPIETSFSARWLWWN